MSASALVDARLSRSQNAAGAFARSAGAWIIVAVGLAASAGLWNGGGMLSTRAGGDSAFLLERVYELMGQIRSGALPARWMADGAYGLGYPFYHYYASLPYYGAALLNLIGINLIDAIAVTQALGMVLAGLAMRAWLRPRLPGSAAVVAAIAYQLAPFHLVNVYVRGDSLSEFYAFIFFPLILLGIDRVWRRESGFGLGLSAAVAGLVLTHNVSAMLFAPFCALYLGLMLVEARRARLSWREIGVRCAVTLLAVLLAAALSAWFWYPALSESAAAQLGDQTSGYFNYAQHFRGADLVQGGLRFDYAVDDFRNPFKMGLAQVLGIGVGTFVAMGSVRRGRTSAAFVVLTLLGLALATFLITPASEAVWKAIPPLALAQFPWRLLSIQTLWGAVLTGFLGARLRPDDQRLAVLITAIALGACMLSGLPNERKAVPNAGSIAQEIQSFEWVSGIVGTTIRGEYLPATAFPQPRTGPVLTGLTRPLVMHGALVAADPAAAPGVLAAWTVETGEGGATLAFPILYWQGLKASVVPAAGGTPSDLAISPAPRLGWAAVSLPAGRWTVAVSLGRTPATAVAEPLSALAVVLFLLLWVWGHGSVSRAWARMRQRLTRGLAWAVCIVLIAALVSSLRPVARGEARFVDFATQPFPHQGPISLLVDGAAYQLQAVDVNPPSARPGEEVAVSFRWAEGRIPPGATLQVLAPSQGLPGSPLLALARRHAAIETPITGRNIEVVLPREMPVGPSLFRVIVGDRQFAFLGPQVLAPAAPDTTIALRSFAPVLPIELLRLDWAIAAPGKVCFSAIWRLPAGGPDAPYSLKYSLRVRGSDGRLVAQGDQEPMQGLAPLWSWPKGAAIYDGICDVTMNFPLTPTDPHTLEVVWYDARTLEAVATVEIKR